MIAVSRSFWIFWIISVPLTLIVILVWHRSLRRSCYTRMGNWRPCGEDRQIWVYETIKWLESYLPRNQWMACVYSLNPSNIIKEHLYHTTDAIFLWGESILICSWRWYHWYDAMSILEDSSSMGEYNRVAFGNLYHCIQQLIIPEYRASRKNSVTMEKIFPKSLKGYEGQTKKTWAMERARIKEKISPPMIRPNKPF